MYYTIYKITNQINNKFYIGSHKTKDLNDKYMGSGKYLKKAQEKYGIENFKKEILFVFETAEEMYAKESELVNEDFLAEENTYNLKIGGFGGWHHINDSDSDHIERCIKAANSVKSKRGWKLSKDKLKDISKRGAVARKEKYPDGTFFNKTHSDATKKLMSEKAKLHSSGKSNSQYGTRWIHSLQLKISRKIKKEESIPEGWIEGRKIIFS